MNSILKTKFPFLPYFFFLQDREKVRGRQGTKVPTTEPPMLSGATKAGQKHGVRARAYQLVRHTVNKPNGKPMKLGSASHNSPPKPR